MEVMVFLAVVFLGLMYYSYYYVKRDQRTNNAQETIMLKDRHLLWIVLGAGAIIRLAFGIQHLDKATDLANFRWLVDNIMKNGYKSVYDSGVNLIFPPLLVQIMAIISVVCKMFGLDYNTIAATSAILIIKLPSIIADLVIAAFFYKAAKKNFAKRSAMILAGLFLINPAVLMDTGVWGHVDSVVSLCILFMCWFLYQEKSEFSVIFFTAAVLLDPLTVVFFPVLLIGILDNLVLDGFDSKKVVRFLIGLAGSVAGGVLICLPLGFSKVWSNITTSFGAFPYCSVNGYNFWNLIGFNWKPETNTYFGVSCKAWGIILVCLFVAVAIVLHYLNKRSKTDYFYLGSFIMIVVFTFGTSMHERYMYNALVLLLMTYVLKPYVENYILYGAFSIAQFGNMAFVFYLYDATKFNPKETVPNMVSKLLVLALVAMIVMVIYRFKNRGKVKVAQTANETAGTLPEEKKAFTIETTSKMPKWTKYDTIALLVIVIGYSIFALHDVGYRSAPETQWSYNTGQDDTNNTIILDMGEVKHVQSIKYFLGNYEKRNFTIEVADTLDGQWTHVSDNELVSVFCWGENVINLETRYVKLTCTSDKAVVFELAVTNADGNLMQPANASEYKNLFDEQDTVPKRSTFRDSTYFDEIYHARTAYEFIHGLYSYENTHPPLGKLIMSIGIRIFGMNPFGWRIMGVLFGIAMLPFLYLLARRMFKETWISAVATTLFAFDFMHFTQTRIATIDVFVTFFIICSYYFMYKYYQTSFYDTSLKQTFVTLGCCGVLMGCQMAAKWTGVYAAAGLAVLFFITLGKRFREYLYAKKDVEGSTNGISHRYIVEHFVGNTWKTIAFCVVFFVIIPVIIYTLSYIPFKDGLGENRSVVARMLKNQETMFTYHQGVHQDHPFASRWWQWPIMYRPIWYFSGHVSDTVSEGISAFGNPAVWWTGIVAFFYLVQRAVRKHDKKAVFLIIAYLSQYLPWVFIGRTTFIYHYFTSVPFVTLMVAYCLYLLVKEAKVPKLAIYGYVAIAIILFLMFYPVLSGQPVSKEYVSVALRWFESWVLVS